MPTPWAHPNLLVWWLYASTAVLSLLSYFLGAKKYRALHEQSGQSHEWNVDLNSLFVLSPGTYFVSVAIELNRFRGSFVVYAAGLRFIVQ